VRAILTLVTQQTENMSLTLFFSKGKLSAKKQQK